MILYFTLLNQQSPNSVLATTPVIICNLTSSMHYFLAFGFVRDPFCCLLFTEGFLQNEETLSEYLLLKVCCGKSRLNDSNYIYLKASSVSILFNSFFCLVDLRKINKKI